MKVINNKSLREHEETETRKNSPAAIVWREIEEQKRKDEERRELTLTVLCDWRLLGQLNPITKAVWKQDEAQNRVNVLRNAISHRNELDEVIVEPFDTSVVNHGYNCIEIEYDKDTINQLCREANRLGLTKLEYVKAILYTTALKINLKRQAEEERQRAAVAEATPFYIGAGFISQNLKRKLDTKYNPKAEIAICGILPTTYTELLVRLANEYFGLEQ